MGFNFCIKTIFCIFLRLAHSYSYIGEMFSTLNMIWNYLSFLCYAIEYFVWAFKITFIVWTSYVYCLLPPNVLSTVRKLSIWWWVVKNCSKRFSHTQRHILSIMLGKARLHLPIYVQKQSSSRSVSGIPNDHIRQRGLFARLANGKHCCFSPP